MGLKIIGKKEEREREERERERERERDGTRKRYSFISPNLPT
jgi:hypothetical protein